MTPADRRADLIWLAITAIALAALGASLVDTLLREAPWDRPAAVAPAQPTASPRPPRPTAHLDVQDA